MSDSTPDDSPPPDLAPDTGGNPVSYEASIKGLFRAKDRNAMRTHFDLWAYQDVKDNAQPIYDQVSSGNMPCDNPWPQENVDLFASWMATGMNP